MKRFRFIVAAMIERTIGRRNLVRCARFLLDFGRRDMRNCMETNGEWLIQDIVLDSFASQALVCVDVGANVGEWSRRLLTRAEQDGVEVQLYAFEPARRTYDALSLNLLPEFGGRVILVQAAVSDHDGRASLLKVHEYAGSNSLHAPIAPTMRISDEEVVDLCTLDSYCMAQGLDHIALLKIDAEGHDHYVLDGAMGLLRSQAIDVVQFEYNTRWISARRFLKDAFETLVPLGYTVGKVTSTSVEWYSDWSAELETYREGNFIGVRSEWLPRFPVLVWWNSRTRG